MWVRLRWREVGWPVVGVAAVVGLWWAATTPLGMQPYLLPPPQEVAVVFVRSPGRLAQHGWVTFQEAVVGFAMAVVIGVAAGVLLGSSTIVNRMFMPVAVYLHAIPKHALAIPLVVALGFGPAPKVVMVVLVAVFPILLATSIGVARTDADLVELARSLGGGRWWTFVKIRMPYALPQVFTGLKQAAPLAVIGAVIGELFGATAGLGYLMRGAGPHLDLVWAALMVLGAMALGVFYTVNVAERLLVPWIRHTTA